MRKGSITPFCALALMLIASLLFALLESARVYGLDCYAAMKAETGIDSVCGEYQPFLWKQYGVLFLDGAYGTEHFSMEYVTESLENQLKDNLNNTGWIQENFGLDLFQLESDDVQLEGYALAADDKGEIFLNYIAEREEENLPLGIAEDLYGQYQKSQDLEKKHGGVEESILTAQRVLSEAETEWLLKQEEENTESGEETEELDTEEYIMPDTSALKSVLNSVGEVRNNGMLKMIFGDFSEISQKNSALTERMQERKKPEGTMSLVKGSNWYQKLLVLEYMEDFFSNYTNKKDEHFLNYEMEYVLCGKNTERENLAGALERIMLMREAANVAYLLQDKEKMELAEGLASLIGLLAGENPGVVKVIQIGIIGVWAYMESILDVRELVSGGVIPLIKHENEWTTEISNLLIVCRQDARAKTCSEGLGYVDYLKQILFMMENPKLAYRMMEVMELGMKQIDDYKNCRMDRMIVALRYRLQFKGKPVFSSLISIGEVYDGNYYFTKEVERCYIP